MEALSDMPPGVTAPCDDVVKMVAALRLEAGQAYSLGYQTAELIEGERLAGYDRAVALVVDALDAAQADQTGLATVRAGRIGILLQLVEQLRYQR